MHILSFLDFNSWKATARVNKSFRSYTLTVVHDEVRHFIKFLVTHIEENFNKRSELLEILDQPLLAYGKSNQIRLRKQIVEILKSLGENNLKELEKSWESDQSYGKLPFYDKTFKLAKIYAGLERINQISDYTERYRQQKNISQLLAENGEFQSAFRLLLTLRQSNGITDEDYGPALNFISKSLTERGELDKAAKVASLIPFHLRIKDEAFRLIATYLNDIYLSFIHAREYDRIVEVAEIITKEDDRNEVFAQIFPNEFDKIIEHLINHNRFDEAREVANKIPDQSIRESFLQQIPRKRTAEASETQLEKKAKK